MSVLSPSTIPSFTSLLSSPLPSSALPSSPSAPSPLASFAYHLLLASGCCITSHEQLRKFIHNVEKKHHAQNSYHGWLHAVHVMFSACRYVYLPCAVAMHSDCVSNDTAWCSPLAKHDTFILLISALCHDLQHCGRSNAWIKAQTWCPHAHAHAHTNAHAHAHAHCHSQHSHEQSQADHNHHHHDHAHTEPHATTTSSTSSSSCPYHAPDSPLEQFSIAESLRIIFPSSALSTEKQHKHDADAALDADTLFANDAFWLDASMRQHFIDQFTSLILSTDITHRARKEHLASQWSGLLSSSPSPTVDSLPSQHVSLLSHYILLCADIGCVAEPFPTFIEWADRLFEENSAGQNYVTSQQIALKSTKNVATQNNAVSCYTQRAYIFEVNDELIEVEREKEKDRDKEKDVVVDRELEDCASDVDVDDDDDNDFEVECDMLSVFYENQMKFLHLYAHPLYTSLHSSNLLPSFAAFYTQLNDNMRYYSSILLVKEWGSKMYTKPRDHSHTTHAVMSTLPATTPHASFSSTACSTTASSGTPLPATHSSFSSGVLSSNSHGSFSNNAVVAIIAPSTPHAQHMVRKGRWKCRSAHKNA